MASDYKPHPLRIQRKRTKGYKMPSDAVYIGRPTKWGNPYEIGRDGNAGECVALFRAMVAGNIWTEPNKYNIQNELRGKRLACFCPLTRPCHADCLAEIANE